MNNPKEEKEIKTGLEIYKEQNKLNKNNKVKNEEVLVGRTSLPIVEPLVNVDEAVKMWNRFKAIKDRLLSEEDIQMIKGKAFIKRSGWRKISMVFNLTTQIIEKRFEYDEDDKIKYAEFTVRTTAPNGRFCDGWGACSITERKFAHLEHDLPATAMTRSINRSISDIAGGGEISAEEAY